MNIKSYMTFLSRNKVYTAINVFGLSVSLMFVMLIGVYVWQEYSVDKQHSKVFGTNDWGKICEEHITTLNNQSLSLR